MGMYFVFGVKACIGAFGAVSPGDYVKAQSLWEQQGEAEEVEENGGSDSVIDPLVSINDDDESAKLISPAERAVRRREKKEADRQKKADAKPPVPFRRIASLAIPEIPLIAFAMIMLVIASGSLLVIPVLFGAIIAGLKGTAHNDFMSSIFGLLAAALVGSVSVLFRSGAFQLAGQRVVARLRIDLYRSIIRQDVSFFDMEKTGEISNRISADTEILQKAITTTISELLRNIVVVVGAMVILLVTSWKLTLVMLSVVPVITLGSIFYGNKLKKMQAKFQDELAASVAIASESIGAIRTVRTFVREGRLFEDFTYAVIESYSWGSKIAVYWAIFQGAIFLISQGAIVLVVWYGATLIGEGELNIEDLVSFMLYSITIAASVASLSNVYGTIMQAVGASHRVFELLDQKPQIPIQGGQDLAPGDGVIQFDNVRFHYPSRKDADVLKGISFQLRPDHITALVGKSGSGKSTIVQLIERFYDPTYGRITHNDVDLKELDVSKYRKIMGYVKQEPTLFNATIKQNILFGLENEDSVTEAELHEAGRQANCHDFIMEFEDGYETEVGERGVQLSGGQRARVAVARALILNPKVLLLDEATAALDSESEYLVTQAIERAMVGRTVLVIAHRLSTVRNAHQVLVMEHGEIVEKGTHDSLLAQKGVYADLVKRQLETTGTL